MPKTVVVALLLILAGAYVVAFTLWNTDQVTVYGFKWGELVYWQQLPSAFLALIGVAIGIVVMCIFTLVSWVSLRGRIKHLSGQIGKAKIVIEQQRTRIADLEDTVAKLRRPKEEPAASAPMVVSFDPEEADPPAEGLGDDDDVI